jgi:hypothetical protein
MPLPEAPQDARDLIFTAGPDEAAPKPARRPPPPTPTADLLAQLARPMPVPEPAAEPVFAVIDEAGREAGIDKVLGEILEDPEAGFRTDAVLYQDFLVRCRIRRVPGEPLPLPAFRRRLAVARAGVDAPTADGSLWPQALALSESLPDDLQGVFLLVARAAVTGAPCPSNAELARAYGTHSERRAQRLLGYFEERGLLVARTDFHGQRVLAFPDLDCETGAGDPNAPAPAAHRDAAE